MPTDITKVLSLEQKKRYETASVNVYIGSNTFTTWKEIGSSLYFVAGKYVGPELDAEGDVVGLKYKLLTAEEMKEAEKQIKARDGKAIITTFPT